MYGSQKQKACSWRKMEDPLYGRGKDIAGIAGAEGSVHRVRATHREIEGIDK